MCAACSLGKIYPLTADVCCCACLQRNMPARTLAHPPTHLPGAALRRQPWCTAIGWHPVYSFRSLAGAVYSFLLSCLPTILP